MRRFVLSLFRTTSRAAHAQSPNTIRVIAGRPESAERAAAHDRSRTAVFAVIRGTLPEHGQPQAG